MPGGLSSSQTFRNTVPQFEEELVTCPYNMAHQLRPDRLVRHLVICRKESLSSSTSPSYKIALAIKICPYNASHHVHKADMEYHLMQCSSAMLGKEQGVLKDDEEPKKSVNTAVAFEDSDEEDWDKEMKGLNLGTYNPMDKVVKNNIPVNVGNTLLNKSGRRDLRSLQRLGDKDGVAQLVNGHDSAETSTGAGYLPVGMNQTSSGKKKKKKKQAMN